MIYYPIYIGYKGEIYEKKGEKILIVMGVQC